MRIVIIVPGFPKLSETFIVNKVLGLLERGWDVQVVCRSSEAREWHHFPLLAAYPGIKRRVQKHWPVEPRWLVALLLLPVLLWTWLRNPSGCFRYLYLGWRKVGSRVLRDFYIDARLVELRPDLVHIEFGALAPELMRLKSRLGCRVVVSFRGYDINFSGIERINFYDPVWKESDAIHVLSNALWTKAVQRGCPLSLPHMLIPPALDESHFAPNRASAAKVIRNTRRPLRILSVGRLEWVKGYEYALQAVKLLILQGFSCEYRIVGSGVYSENILFACHQLGLVDVVTLTGALAQEQVREQLNWADVMLHAAVSEGFCNAVIEAQAMELPVVCSDAGGLPENVVNGVTGLVVPRRDPQALADALARLASDGLLRAQMGRAGRSHVLAKFRLEDQIIAFEQLYRQVVTGSEQ